MCAPAASTSHPRAIPPLNKPSPSPPVAVKDAMCAKSQRPKPNLYKRRNGRFRTVPCFSGELTWSATSSGRRHMGHQEVRAGDDHLAALQHGFSPGRLRRRRARRNGHGAPAGRRRHGHEQDRDLGRPGAPSQGWTDTCGEPAGTIRVIFKPENIQPFTMAAQALVIHEGVHASLRRRKLRPVGISKRPPAIWRRPCSLSSMESRFWKPGKASMSGR